MKVSELIAELQQCDPESLVVMSKDSEGNNFSPLAEIDGDSMYLADSTWSGDVHLRELTPELEEQGYSDDDVRTEEDGAVRCIVLWPTN
jgi:hypothetical protein